jgi:hypothetical protein
LAALKITCKSLPEDPGQQPAIVVHTTCAECGTPVTRHYDQPGFVPRLCDECRKAAAVRRVQRWRENHPEAYRQIKEKQRQARRKPKPPD